VAGAVKDVTGAVNDVKNILHAQTDAQKDLKRQLDTQKNQLDTMKDISRNQVDEITNIFYEQKKKAPYILLAVAAINAVAVFGVQLDLKDLTRKAKAAAIQASSTEVAVSLAVVVAFFAIYKIFEVPTNKTT
jgi:uncharacterized protein YbjQ (UPF0145 family)